MEEVNFHLGRAIGAIRAVSKGASLDHVFQTRGDFGREARVDVSLSKGDLAGGEFHCEEHLELVDGACQQPGIKRPSGKVSQCCEVILKRMLELEELPRSDK